jgi:membrane-associated phospholipid phosphatase
MRRLAIPALTLVLLGLAVACYVWVDRPLALWLKAEVGGPLESFLKTATHLGLGAVWLVPSGLFTCGFWVWGYFAPTEDIQHRLYKLARSNGYVFAAIAVSGLANTAIKVVVGRTRPKLLFEDGTYSFVHFTRAYATNSLPSGHTQTAFAAMVALAVVFPRLRVFWLGIALLVAASRVLTTVHFLSDALVGAWLGTVTALWFRQLMLARGWNPRLPR